VSALTKQERKILDILHSYQRKLTPADRLARRFKDYERIKVIQAAVALMDGRTAQAHALKDLIDMVFDRDIVITAALEALSFQSPSFPEGRYAYDVCWAIVSARRQLFAEEESKRAAREFKRKMRRSRG
jgi:hypothetical protein